ncbi:hypothetical protein A0Z39_08275 [Campylobacter lari]|nr:hypothetical protein [Campylobacter lari]
MEAKAFNQVLKASAKISIFGSRGILGEISNWVYPLAGRGSDGGEKGYYSEGYSNFTMTHIGMLTYITIFGYHNAEDARKANIKVTYTSAYGGNKQKINVCNISTPRTGSDTEVFSSKQYGIGFFEMSKCGTVTKQNNGIYKFEDLNNKYIKPTYLHLKLP